MNKLLAILLIFSFNAAATDAKEFDEASCQGDTISDERALELLGSANKVKLNDGIDPLYYRVRQKINGKVGQWSTSTRIDYRLNALIFNNKGQLAFDFYVKGTPINCRLVTASSFRCDRHDGSYDSLPTWGTGTFIGKITNNCIQLKSATSDEGADYEWAYLIQF